jgi:hypothetical protein
MQSDCLDWIKHQPMNLASFFGYKIDIHHIFPKDWCAKNGIDRNRQESIVNKTAISFDTNRVIGGKSPAEYVKVLERRAGIEGEALDDVLATHLLDPDALRAADFDAFFKHRRAALISLISEAMGKPVNENLDEAAELSEVASYETEELEISDDELVVGQAAG